MKLGRELYADNYETVTTTTVETTDRPAQVRVREVHGGLPHGNFAAILDPDRPNAERVMVTQVSGDTYTFASEPGQRPQLHDAGAVFRHTLTARSLVQPMLDHLAHEDPHPQYVRESVWSRVGDLVVGVRNGLAVMPRGEADGLVLTTDSSNPMGMAWRNLPAAVLGAVQSVGDLLIGGLHEGVVKPVGLAVGELYSSLLLTPGAPLLEDPTAPILVVADSTAPQPPPAVFAPRTVYWLTYAWGNEFGWTRPAPGRSWLSLAEPIAQDVVLPAAPAGALRVRVWLADADPREGEPPPDRYGVAAELEQPATAATNHLTLDGTREQSGGGPPQINATGHPQPAWRRLLATDGDLLTMQDGAYTRIPLPPRDGPTWVLAAGGNVPRWLPSSIEAPVGRLSEDVLLETAGGWYGGPSVEVPPGDWLLIGHVQCQHPQQASAFVAALWVLGRAALDSSEAWTAGPAQGASLMLCAPVRVAEPTSYTISVSSPDAGGVIRASTTLGGVAGSASTLVAFPGRL